MDENLIQVLKLIGYGVGGLLTILGGGKIVELIVNYFIRKKEEARQIHQSQTTKQLDFDQVAFRKMLERQDKLESKLEDITEKLNSQMVNNAELKKENEHLSKDNESLRGRVRELEKELNDTKLQLQSIRQEFEAWKREVNQKKA